MISHYSVGQEYIVLDKSLILSYGIENGLTTILRIGNSFVWKALNMTFKEPVVGMNNILSPHEGMSGVRIIAVENKHAGFPKCQLEGVDIPLGFAGVIGLKAKKTIHLAHPYSNCTFVNLEYKHTTMKHLFTMYNLSASTFFQDDDHFNDFVHRFSRNTQDHCR